MKILPRFTLSDSTLAETRRLSVNFLWWDYSPWMRKLRDAVVIRPSFIIAQWAVQQQRVLGGRSSFATTDETLQTDLVSSKTRALNSGILQKTGRRHRGLFSDINVQSGHLITRASNSYMSELFALPCICCDAQLSATPRLSGSHQLV